MRSALCALRGSGVRALLVALGAILAACTLPMAEKPGATRAEVQSRLGTPTAVYALDAGERLIYSTLPAGFEAYALDFDASAKLVRSEQVLTQSRFEALASGAHTRDTVLHGFGPPMLVERVSRFDGDIWTYRFRQNSDPRLAHVHLDRQGVVRMVLFTDELPLFDNARD